MWKHSSSCQSRACPSNFFGAQARALAVLSRIMLDQRLWVSKWKTSSYFSLIKQWQWKHLLRIYCIYWVQDIPYIQCNKSENYISTAQPFGNQWSLNPESDLVIRILVYNNISSSDHSNCHSNPFKDIRHYPLSNNGMYRICGHVIKSCDENFWISILKGFVLKKIMDKTGFLCWNAVVTFVQIWSYIYQFHIWNQYFVILLLSSKKST